jgi:hypothetical protein
MSGLDYVVPTVLSILRNIRTRSMKVWLDQLTETLKERERQVPRVGHRVGICRCRDVQADIVAVPQFGRGWTRELACPKSETMNANDKKIIIPVRFSK